MNIAAIYMTSNKDPRDIAKQLYKNQLGKSGFNILSLLIENYNGTDKIFLSNDDIKQKLNTPYGNPSVQIKKLKELGIITEGMDRKGRRERKRYFYFTEQARIKLRLR